MGPVMVNDLTFFERKKYVVRYMESRPLTRDVEEWADQHDDYLSVDLSTRFHPIVREEVDHPRRKLSGSSP